MKTNQKLTDLSIGDLISLFNHVDWELDLLENCSGAESAKNKAQLQIIAVQEEIEKRRIELFKK